MPTKKKGDLPPAPRPKGRSGGPRTAAKAPPKPAPKAAAKPAAKKAWTVIRDSREKAGHGYYFDPSPRCSGTVVRALKTGDYSLEGLEHLFTVDRKATVAEFANNLTESRFRDELARMKEYRVAVVLLEFQFEDMLRFPAGSDVPPYRWKSLRMKGDTLVSTFLGTRLAYPHVIFEFAGYYGKEWLTSFFKRMIDKYGSEAA